MALQDQNPGQPEDIVRWELPSTHAADPTSASGFFANGQFVQALASFTYNNSYRVATVVDENLQTQQAQILDGFGEVISAISAQPLAQPTAGHASVLQIGNSSALRGTDTLLNFIFVRPVAGVEPEITVFREH